MNFVSDERGVTVVLSDLQRHSELHESSVNFQELQIIKKTLMDPISAPGAQTKPMIKKALHRDRTKAC